jgi:hypothetical protein
MLKTMFYTIDRTAARQIIQLTPSHQDTCVDQPLFRVLSAKHPLFADAAERIYCSSSQKTNQESGQPLPLNKKGNLYKGKGKSPGKRAFPEFRIRMNHWYKHNYPVEFHKYDPILSFTNTRIM